MAASEIKESYIKQVLTCPVCLELGREPQTLTQCMHNICQQCLQRLLRENSTGVQCPICRKFSAKHEIRNNFILKDMLRQFEANEQPKQRKSKQSQPRCEQCPDGKPAGEIVCRCLDCRVNLCRMCKSQHMKLPILKGHRVHELSASTEMVPTDDISYCNIHKDKTVRFFCDECQELVCATCTVTTHKYHAIDATEDALGRLLTSSQRNLGSLHEICDDLDKQLNGIRRCKYALQKQYQSCKVLVEKRGSELITEISKQMNELKDSLTKEEKKQVRLLEKRITQNLDLKNEVTCNIDFINMGIRSKFPAKNLLNCLVNIELAARNNELTSRLLLNESITTKNPQLSNAWDTISGIVGNLSFASVVIPTEMGELENFYPAIAGTSYWEGRISDIELCSSNDPSLGIYLQGYCRKISIIEGHIWAPMMNQKKILIYSQAGRKTRTIPVWGKPVSVEQTTAGDILVACIDTGLHVIDMEYFVGPKIADGNFSDICMCDGQLFAWNFVERKVIKFVKGATWKKERVVSVTPKIESGREDRILVKECEEDNTKKVIFISSIKENKIYEINEDGKQIRWYGAKWRSGDDCLENPRLCGVMSNGTLVFADQGHRKIKLLLPDGHVGQWETLCTFEQDAYDIKAQGFETLWILQTEMTCSVLRKFVVSNRSVIISKFFSDN